MAWLIIHRMIQSTMLYGSETWRLNEKVVTILRREEQRCHVWCEANGQKKHQRLNGYAWPGCLNWNDGEGKCIAMVWACSKGRRKQLTESSIGHWDSREKRGRPKSTSREKVKENLKKVDLKEDAFNRTKWRGHLNT